MSEVKDEEVKSEVKEEVKNKGRIVWVSSSPFVGDACGKQSHYICKGLVEAGYNVDFIAWNWNGIASGVVYDFDGITMLYPYGLNSILSGGGKRLYNLHSFNSIVYENVLSANPTALITLGDYQNVVPIGALATRHNVKWYNWFPVDYVTWDMSVAKTFYEQDCHLVTMSDWGYKLASENFYQPVANIYHGVDTKIFRPYPEKKVKIRNILNLPKEIENNFLVGFVGRNMERKRLDKLVEAFAIFAKDKSNVSLLMHTDPYENDTNNPSYPLIDMIGQNGLQNKFLYTHPVNYHIKYDDHGMASLYNAFNVQILPSSGEGFGVPVLEGNACGTPCIMTNSTSAQQLVGQGQGFLADTDSTYVFRGFRRSMVSAESIAKWLDTVYTHPDILTKASVTAITDAQKYDFSIIQKQWVDLIEKK